MTSDGMRADDRGAPCDDPRRTADRAADRVILAAGGIVLTEGPSGPEVLVVHRPGYDDWTLPKGHVDAGEDLEATALREVAEETGVPATITGPAGLTHHAIEGRDGPAVKQVHWFHMQPAGGLGALTRPPDAEVDRVDWWPVPTAITRLTYAGERALLRGAFPAGTSPGAFT